MSFEPGTELGPYVVRSFIDAGGMGEVYSAFDPRLERQVAIKVLPAGLAALPEFRRRFRRETQAISRLNHKNICTIYDTGSYQDRPYIVMELMEGETLESLRESFPMDVERLLHIGIQVANALDGAHREGIIHRDIKSANIFVNTRGDAKVLDFGIAKVTTGGVGTDHGAEGRITAENTRVGTVAFMSPEQARGEEVDARSDLFSLGVVLHEMATGLTPFRGTATSILTQLVSSDSIPKPRSLNPALPEALERVICRALEKDKRVRYQTAADLLAALRGVRRDLFLSSPPFADTGDIPEGGLPHGKGRPVTPVLGWGALVLAVVVAAVFWFLPEGSDIESIAVLPCRTQGAVGPNEHFCHSVAQRLIAALSEASQDLVVTSYARVEPYASDPRGVFEIGDELRVDAIASLYLREEGGVQIVQVEVANVRTGAYVGGDRVHVMDSGNQQFLEQITNSVAENIQLQLSDADRERLEIAQKFADAQYRWSLRTAPDLKRAVELYSEVIQADARHARAHGGLAISYILLHYYGDLSPEESYPIAKASAERALQLDGSLADAHAALGLVYRDHEMNFARAELEFQEALRLDPRSASANQWYAEFLAITQRFTEAEDFIVRAELFAPHEAAIKAVHGWIRVCAGDTKEASRHLQAALAMDPDNPLANWFLGQLHFAEGDYHRAVETLQAAVPLNGYGSRVRADLAGALAMGGNQTGALDLLSDLMAGSAAGENVSMYESAIVHAALGDSDRAFEELEEALGEGTWQVANMAVDPMLALLHRDPRFPGLLVRAGFGGTVPENE